MFFNFTEPDRDTEEAFSISEVENDNDTVCTFVVGIRNRAIPFLPSCIPDLQLNRGLVNTKGAETEIYSNRTEVVFLKTIILQTNNS